MLIRAGFTAAAIGCLTACGDSTSEPVPLTEVTTIVVTAPSSSIFRDDTLQLVASVFDQNGAALSGIPVTWSSSNPLAASLDSTGLLVGLAPGQVSITASAENKSGTVQITVIGPGTDGAVPGSALIGTAGGGVAATLPGGGSLALSIPAGALNSNVEISLEPLVPGPGAQAAFQIAPPGLRLTTPATLVVKVSPGARVRATTVLVFEQDGRRVPVPSVADPAAGTVTATLGMLGLPEDSSAAANFRTTVLPGGNGSLLDLTIDDMVDDAVAALAQLRQLGTFPAADAMQLSMDAVVQAGGQSNSRFLQLQAEWRAVVCDAGDFAVNAMQSFGFVSDYRGLARVIGAVLGWGSAEAQMRGTMSQIGLPGCLRPALDARALVLAKLSAFQSGIRADLNGFGLSPAPRDSVFLIDRISPLLDLVSSLQAAGFDAPADVLINEVSAQFVRIRFIGYTECRGGQRQEIQGRLLRLEAAGGVFAAVSPFDVAALEGDIELCGMDLGWKLLDSTGAVTTQGRLGGGTGPGNTTLSGTGMIRGVGRLVVQGPLLALRCPAPASANAEQFEVVAGRTLQSLVRVAVLTPSNQDSYLEVSPLTVGFDAIRAAAGIPPDGAGQASVVFRRIGGTCSGQFVNLAHSPLGTLTLDIEPEEECPANLREGFLRAPGLPSVCAAPVSIVTATLPGGTVGSAYSTALQASGGGGNYQWSVTTGQLPPGLSLGTNGTISGAPTTAGTFTFNVRVVGGTQNAERVLAISIAQPAGPLEWHFDTDLEGWSCNSTSSCKWQLLTSNQNPVTSGWVALQSIGSAVSRTLAIPSSARFLRFGAATHNVPGDVSRVQVQVGGVTVLDTTFVNPGSNTAFNFVPMTIDISARAGQTVNIRFVQLDDGAGTGTTLKIDDIRIEAN